MQALLRVEKQNSSSMSQKTKFKSPQQTSNVTASRLKQTFVIPRNQIVGPNGSKVEFETNLKSMQQTLKKFSPNQRRTLADRPSAHPYEETLQLTAQTASRP